MDSGSSEHGRGASERGQCCRPRASAAVKVVIVGGFGVGKTTLVGSVSEIRPLTTEETMTQAGVGVDDTAGVERKTPTTVAMDFGRISLNEELVLYLFGTPGSAALLVPVERPLRRRAGRRGARRHPPAGGELRRHRPAGGIAACPSSWPSTPSPTRPTTPSRSCAARWTCPTASRSSCATPASRHSSRDVLLPLMRYLRSLATDTGGEVTSPTPDPSLPGPATPTRRPPAGRTSPSDTPRAPRPHRRRAAPLTARPGGCAAAVRSGGRRGPDGAVRAAARRTRPGGPGAAAGRPARPGWCSGHRENLEVLAHAVALLPRLPSAGATCGRARCRRTTRWRR